MKKRIFFLSFLGFIFAFFLSFKFIYGQSSSSKTDNGYQTFLYRLVDINQHSQFYLSMLNQNRDSLNLSSNNNLLQALKDLQQSRALAIESYFIYLRSELAKTTKILEYQDNLAYVYLDNYQNEARKFSEEIYGLTDWKEIKQRSLRYEENYLSGRKLAYRAIGLINYKKFMDFLSFLLTLIEEESIPDEENLVSQINLIKKDVQAQQRTFLASVDKNSDSQGVLRNHNQFLSQKKEEVALLLKKTINNLN